MLRLAWRNIWRNLRRSLITVASMGCGLAAIMFGQSMIKSVQRQLIEKATGSITGHVQVQSRSIKDFKFPDKYIAEPEPVAKALAGQKGVKAFGRRITITGLVSSPTASQGVLILGVEPEKERLITTMGEYITTGTYLGSQTRGVVMGDKLAQRLDLRLGEKAVVMAQADDGSMGAEALRLVGLYHTGSETFDGQIIHVPLSAAQELLVTGPKVHQFVARLDEIDDVDRVRSELAGKLGREAVQVITWKDVDREILGVQKFQNGLLSIILLVVFAIVALGILNTLLMSLFERVREFGVLMAMGARPGWVLKLVLFESVLLGLVGTAAGFSAGVGMIAYYHRAGLHLPIGEAISYFIPFPDVLYLSPTWPGHLFAAACVLVTSVIAAIGPGLRASRLRPAEALRHV